MELTKYLFLDDAVEDHSHFLLFEHRIGGCESSRNFKDQDLYFF